MLTNADLLPIFRRWAMGGETRRAAQQKGASAEPNAVGESSKSRQDLVTFCPFLTIF